MIIIMGVAGAGKTMQGTMLAAELGCEWISIGNILRQHITDERRERMQAGELMADEETIDLLSETLTACKASENECILDGCPRTLRQAEWLVEQIRAGKLMFTSVIHILADKKLVKERLLKRGRLDDREEAIAQRFKEYDETIVPIVQLLEDQGFKVHTINGEGSIEEVHTRVLGALS